MRASSFGLILFSVSSSMLFGVNNFWTGSISDLWSNAGNWSAGVPVNGQDLGFPSGVTNNAMVNDLGTNPNINSMIFVQNYTLSGNAITLGGTTPEISVPPEVSPATVSISTNLILSSNCTINALNNGNGLTIGGAISDGGNNFSLTYNGLQILSLSGTNTYGGGTIIEGASIINAPTSSIPVPAAGNGVTFQTDASSLTFIQNAPGTYAGSITGPGNLGIVGSAVTLSNTSNNWSGATSINNTATLIGTTATIPSTTTITFDTGIPGGVFNLNQNFAGTFSPTITGVGAVLISGGGAVTLSNTGNTYNQGTTVTSATLVVGADGNLGATGTSVTLGLAPGDTPGFQANAGFTTTRPFTLNATNCIIDPNSFTLIHQGSASGTGGLQVGESTGGSLLVEGAYTYTGGTTVQSGTLVLAAAGSLPPPGVSPAGDVILNSNASLALDMSSGTAQSVGNVSGSGNIFLGPNFLTVTSTVPKTYSGNISSTGGVFMSAASTSTWSWTGNSNYSGPTEINGGTLAIVSPGNFLATGPLTVTSPGTFDISGAGSPQTANNISGTGAITLGSNKLIANSTTPTTFSGVISGVGGQIVKNGTSTWSLGGVNTYTGVTTINAGTLAITGSGMIPSTGPMTITSPGIFDISGASSAQTIGTLSGTGSINLGSNTLNHVPTGNTAFSGTLSGSSSSEFNQNAAFTLTLSGVSPSMGGELRVSQGTIQAGAANILPNLRLLHVDGTFSLNGFDQSMGDLDGSGILNLGGNTFTSNSQSDHTYSGVIQGIGSSRFIHNGSSTLTLEGVSTTTGAFEVAGGKVFVDTPASLASATTTVDGPGKLQGTGTVGTLNNFGVVEPGPTIGTTLNVTGTYTESGTLEINVNDLGQSTRLAINGALDINSGTTLHVKPKLGTYSSSTVYTVVTNTGARTGTYSNIQTTLSNRFHVTAIYDPNDIKISLGITPFPIIINGGNAGAVAACFETIPGGSGTDHETVMNALEAISDDLVALRKAFNQLQPSQLGDLALAQQNNDILVRSALSQRFAYRRTLDRLPRPISSDTTTESDNQPQTPAPKLPHARKGTVWVEGLGKYAHQDNKQDNPGFKAATGGALIGADYRCFSKVYLGTALGYTSTNLHLNKASGHAHIHSGYGALYGTWFSDRAFLDATAIAAFNHYHVNRHIHFTGINRHAKNSHNGYELAGSLGLGFFINVRKFQIQPYDRADFIFTHQNKFREHGAQSINLRVRHKDSRYVRNDMGVKVLRCWQFSKASLIPYIKASWIWEQQLDKGHLSASFTQSSCQFIVIGMHPVRALFAPSIGLTTLAYKDAFSFSFHYDAEIGSKFWENRAYLSFAYRY